MFRRIPGFHRSRSRIIAASFLRTLHFVAKYLSFLLFRLKIYYPPCLSYADSYSSHIHVAFILLSFAYVFFILVDFYLLFASSAFLHFSFTFSFLPPFFAFFPQWLMPGWGGEIFRSHIHIPGVKGAYYSEGMREQWHGPRMSADSSLTVDIGTGMSGFLRLFENYAKRCTEFLHTLHIFVAGKFVLWWPRNSFYKFREIQNLTKFLFSFAKFRCKNLAKFNEFRWQTSRNMKSNCWDIFRDLSTSYPAKQS